MAALLEWTFFLVVLFPWTLALLVGLCALTRTTTRSAPPRVRRIARGLAYTSAATSAASCLTAFALWWAYFDEADSPSGVPRSIDYSIDVNQWITTAALAIVVATTTAAAVHNRYSAGASVSDVGPANPVGT